MKLYKSILHTFLSPSKYLFWGFLGILFGFVLLYGFLVQGTIMNIVERKNIEHEKEKLSSLVTINEAHYNKLKEHITYEYAYNNGFVEAQGEQYATRKYLVGLAR